MEEIKKYFKEMYLYKKKMDFHLYENDVNIFDEYTEFSISNLFHKIDFKKYKIPLKKEKLTLKYVEELFDFFSKRIIHDGETKYRGLLYGNHILKYIYDEKLGVNCLMHAIIMQEIFLSQGIRAHLIQGNPYDYEINDCHWLVNLYVDEYSKWVLIDPVWYGYCINREGIPLDFFEIRKLINKNEKIIVNKSNKCEYYQYLLCRYLFFIAFFKINDMGTFEISNQIKYYLSPKNFNTKLYVEKKEKNRFIPFDIKEYMYFSRFEEKSKHI